MIKFDWKSPHWSTAKLENMEIWETLHAHLPPSYLILDRSIFLTFCSLFELPERPYRIDFSSKYDCIFSFKPVAFDYYSQLDTATWDKILEHLPQKYKIPDLELLNLSIHDEIISKEHSNGGEI